MLFASPYFLLGLLAIAIPVIIHLFNFRRFRKIWFSNVRFIRDIQLQTRKQSRLRHLIILALRILAVAALSIAFAQPYIPSGDHNGRRGGQNAVSIFADNSFSMEAASDRGQLLDEARYSAEEIAAAYPAATPFQLLTSDFSGMQQRFISRDELLEQTAIMDYSPMHRKLSEVITRQTDLMSSASQKNKDLYVISDFQLSFFDPENIRFDSTVRVHLIPLKANPTPNIYIDTCWFASPVHQPGQNVKLTARVRNVSEQDYEKVPLKLLINGRQKAVSSFNLTAGSETTVSLSWSDLEAGSRMGVLELTDHPVVYDDRFYFSYEVLARIPILSVHRSQPNVYLNALLGNDSSLTWVRNTDRALDYSSFKQYSFLILDELPEIPSGLADEVASFVSKGGSVLIIPAADADADSYNRLLSSIGLPALGPWRSTKQLINRINLSHPIFRNVFDYIPENIDLPAMLSYYALQPSGRQLAEDLLVMQNGTPALCASRSGAGKAYLFASPLRSEVTAFMQHAIFVPAIYNMALLSQQQSKLYYITGGEDRLEYRGETGGDQVLKIRKAEGDWEFIPRQLPGEGGTGIYVHDQVREAGHYVLNAGEKDLAVFAFNYPRDESDLRTLEPEEIRKGLEKAGLTNFSVLENTGPKLSTTIQDMNMGLRLWKLFIILALVFLAAEVLLLRFWRSQLPKAENTPV